jgi:hypothetical protein
MHKLLLLLITGGMACHAGAQQLRIFRSNGSVWKDTIDDQSVARLQELSGSRYTYVYAEPKTPTQVLFTPLTNRPLIGLARSNADFRKAVSGFDFNAYICSNAFERDFDIYKRARFTQDSVIAYLGKPYKKTGKKNNETFEYLGKGYRFQLTFKDRLLQQYTRYNMKATRYNVTVQDYKLLGEDGTVTGISLTLTNNYRKRLQKLTLTIRGFNGLPDFAEDVTREVTTPVYSRVKKTIQLNHLFQNKFIDAVVVTSLKAQFADGTTQVYSGKQVKGLFYQFD